jgi:hypothetical protein
LDGTALATVPLFPKLGFPRGYELVDFDGEKRRLTVRRSVREGTQYYEMDFGGNILLGPFLLPGMEHAFRAEFKRLDRGWIAWCSDQLLEKSSIAHGAVAWDIDGHKGIYRTSGPRNLNGVVMDPSARLLALRESYEDTGNPFEDKLKILRLSDGKVLLEENLSANAGPRLAFLGSDHLVYMEKKPGNIPVLCIAKIPAEFYGGRP